MSAGPAVNPLNLWRSTKFERKLTEQLGDPLAIATGALPPWVRWLPPLCPSLWSKQSRLKRLRFIGFGVSRAVELLQEDLDRAENGVTTNELRAKLTTLYASIDRLLNSGSWQEAQAANEEIMTLEELIRHRSHNHVGVLIKDVIRNVSLL